MPAPAPPTNQGRTFPAEPLTPDEVRALLDAASKRSSSGIRMRALIGVMYGAGLRVGEALALKPRDIDTVRCSVRVRNGKGAKTRTVGLDPGTCDLVNRWIDRRASLGLTSRDPLFATYDKRNVGHEVSQRYVRHALVRLAERAGIDKRVHPHGLRHSLAYELTNDGVPTHVIQRQLGHGSLAVTDRYVRHLAPTDVIDIMRHREWVQPTTRHRVTRIGRR